MGLLDNDPETTGLSLYALGAGLLGNQYVQPGMPTGAAWGRGMTSGLQGLLGVQNAQAMNKYRKLQADQMQAEMDDKARLRAQSEAWRNYLRGQSPQIAAGPGAQLADAGGGNLFAGMDPNQRAMLANLPDTMLDQIAAKYIGKQFDEPPTPKIEKYFDEQGRERLGYFDSRQKSMVPLGGAKSNLLSPEEVAQKKEIAGAGRPVTNVTVSGEKKGSEVLYQKTAEAFDTAQQAERNAIRNQELYDRMAQAGKAFRTGSLAEERLGAQKMLQEIGVPIDPNTSEGEVLRQLGSRLQVTSAPKGQGQVSNYERQLFAQAVPTITMTPDGLQKALDIAKKLDAFDRKVARIYRDNARKGGGVPDPVTVNEEISALGAPLSQSEMSILGGGQSLPVTTPESGKGSGWSIRKKN